MLDTIFFISPLKGDQINLAPWDRTKDIYKVALSLYSILLRIGASNFVVLEMISGHRLNQIGRQWMPLFSEGSYMFCAHTSAQFCPAQGKLLLQIQLHISKYCVWGLPHIPIPILIGIFCLRFVEYDGGILLVKRSMIDTQTEIRAYWISRSTLSWVEMKIGNRVLFTQLFCIIHSLQLKWGVEKKIRNTL